MSDRQGHLTGHDSPCDVRIQIGEERTGRFVCAHGHPIGRHEDSITPDLEERREVVVCALGFTDRWQGWRIRAGGTQ